MAIKLKERWLEITGSWPNYIAVWHDWKEAENVWYKIGSNWERMAAVWYKDGATWRKVLTGTPAPHWETSNQTACADQTGTSWYKMEKNIFTYKYQNNLCLEPSYYGVTRSYSTTQTVVCKDHLGATIPDSSCPAATRPNETAVCYGADCVGGMSYERLSGVGILQAYVRISPRDVTYYNLQIVYGSINKIVPIRIADFLAYENEAKKYIAEYTEPVGAQDSYNCGINIYNPKKLYKRNRYYWGILQATGYYKAGAYMISFSCAT